MYEPWRLKGSGWRNHWYIDLIRINWLSDSSIEVVDLYVDIWVKGIGPTYEMLDLHELADALAVGKVGVEELKEPLCCLQKFLDNHLNFGAKDFPPQCIRPFMPENQTESRLVRFFFRTRDLESLHED
jgi:hypothetical protein